ncbi:SDR family oxidoreductase [Aeromicrobium sp.]|uniref:SDR family oxidoreductase n=1 Tax=Aeromicrobium sp. TaxID=1871063 RepID=UPI003D6A40DC
MNIDRSAPVLVTGGNGYIASWLVRYLLEDGIDVHATVRDPSNDTKVGHLKQLAKDTPGTLTLLAADLVQDGSFDEAMAGCELVMHTASPFALSVKDPQQDLVDPAVQGTRNVLESANRVNSVKRVVLTSSVVSIYGDARDLEQAPGDVFTEDDWNTTSTLSHQPYSYSKVVAERAAWKIAEAQDRWDLVVINPGFVLGPSLTTASDSASISTIMQFVDGRLLMGAPALEVGVVDVRDVALAHIKAGFTPAAAGRHICVNRSMTFMDVGRVLRRQFGGRYLFPRLEAPKAMIWLAAPIGGVTRKYVATNVGYPLRFDTSKSRTELGMEFRPTETTIVEHFEQLIDDGIVRDRRR